MTIKWRPWQIVVAAQTNELVQKVIEVDPIDIVIEFQKIWDFTFDFQYVVPFKQGWKVTPLF